MLGQNFKKISVAVLISDKGTGTNLQAIIDAVNAGKVSGKIVVVVSDTPKALGLIRAKKNNLKIEICPKKTSLKSILKKYQPDFVALAGWKQIITDDLIETFPNKIINLHPGLIPDKKNGVVKNPDDSNALWNRGLLAEKAVNNFLVNHASYAGSSVHFLTKEFDFGPVLARGFVKTRKNDTVTSLYSRIKQKEHEIYVKVLQNLSKNKKATVLVIDGGGRAHALIKKYLQSKHVARAIAIPGNDLMLLHKNVKIFPQTKTTDISEIINICKKEKVDLVDVAQDDAVAVGLVDELTRNEFKVFGPTKSAGQIEWDKAWARNFMKKFSIAHPAFKISQSQKEGVGFVKKQKEGRWYVKASGLAAGKGALYAGNNNDAIKRINQMKEFGKAGHTYLIEKCLIGEEFSSFAIVNGKSFEILGHAQDHKNVFDGGNGPNTGGMGCSSPPMAITPKIEKQIKLIFKKTVEGLVKIGRPYVGVLYLGGLIDIKGKVWVIEFNARWGDPEAQVIIPSIKNDLWELVCETIIGKISKIKKDNVYRLVVAATSKGYPKDYSKVVGCEIKGLKNLLKSKAKVFGAGVKKQNGKFVAAGGRLFYVLGEGENVIFARHTAYSLLAKVSIERDNLHFRKDIGYRDLERLLPQK